MSKPKTSDQNNSAAPTIPQTMALQGPALFDLVIPSNNRQAKPIEKKIITEKTNANPKENALIPSTGRKKTKDTISNYNDMTVSTNSSGKQNINRNQKNTYIQCNLSFEDESKNYLDSSFIKQVNLAPEEFEQILLFVEEVEQKRRKQEREEQERRSWAVIQKIANQAGGQEFLEEHCISQVEDEESGQEQWVQSIMVMKAEGEAEEISQSLNFYNPQHSWILENWLSKQATSWTVKRYSSSSNQVIYQVSFGFPDQTFLEAEGPNREGAILAVAEDLYD